jgi:ATPase family associated with various cellular activities (AAA)
MQNSQQLDPTTLLALMSGRGGDINLHSVANIIGTDLLMKVWTYVRQNGAHLARERVLPAVLRLAGRWWRRPAPPPPAPPPDAAPAGPAEEVSERPTVTLHVSGAAGHAGPHSDVMFFVCNNAPDILEMHCTKEGYSIKALADFPLLGGDVLCSMWLEDKDVSADNSGGATRGGGGGAVSGAATAAAAAAPPTKRLRVQRVLLKSNKLTMAQLQEFVKMCEQLREQAGQGLKVNQLYVLNIDYAQYSDETDQFTAYPLYTNRNLSNVFLAPDIKAVLATNLERFKESEWYAATGRPQTFGVLLHGPPGTGKTSMIKALAKDTNRHIVNVRLSSIRDGAHLESVFYNEKIEVNGRHVMVPVDKRMYVFEDVDADCDIVLRREDAAPPQAAWPRRGNGRLTLADLLNVLDGVRESPGRMIVMTTNHYDKLDGALLRAGRLDVHVLLGNMCESALRDMLRSYCGSEASAEVDRLGLSGVCDQLTPAEASCAIISASCDPERALGEMRKTCARKEAERREREEKERREREEAERREREEQERREREEQERREREEQERRERDAALKRLDDAERLLAERRLTEAEASAARRTRRR